MPLPVPSPPSPAEAAGHLWGRMGQSSPLWGTFLTLPAFLKFLPLSADFYPRALRGCLHPCSTHPGEWLRYEFSEAPPHRQCLHPVGVRTPRPASTETSMDDAEGGAPAPSMHHTASQQGAPFSKTNLMEQTRLGTDDGQSGPGRRRRME